MTPGDKQLGDILAIVVEQLDPTWLLIVFCRIGGCLMMAPGIGGAIIPVRIRLACAIATSVAVAPIVPSGVNVRSDVHVLLLLQLCISELVIGICIGLLGRAFLSMLEFLGTVASIGVGLANPFGLVLEQGEILAPLATFVSFAAVAAIFAADLHLQILVGLIESYAIMPVSGAFDAGRLLDGLVGAVSHAARLALRVFSPFIMYSVIINFTICLINRLTPQVAIFYISTPFIIAGAFWILQVAAAGLVGDFITDFGNWLSRG